MGSVNTKCLLGFVVATVAVAKWLTFGQTSVLIVDGEVEKGLAPSIEDLRAMPHQRGEVDDQGRRSTYEVFRLPRPFAATSIRRDRFVNSFD
ncbi:MAG: hypothetical protein C5B57_00420 [Blastocatellia bacterium]|nr:MAG: hypothetical protein C5B57_00420 [Blastocatellia bacterium]